MSSSRAGGSSARGKAGDIGAVLLERANELVPVLRERAERTEAIRRLPEETINEAAEAGLFEMLAPPHYGGLGLGVREFLDVVRVLAHGCASSAWTLGFLIEHSGQLGRHSKSIQDTVFTERPYVLATMTQAGAGIATAVDGGYRLTGRWRYATGVNNSKWIGITGTIEGSPGAFNFTLPVEEVEVHDTWHTSGMRGTGSHDVSTKDVFVPEHMVMDRAAYLSADNPGLEINDYEWIRYRSDEPLGLILPALALGAAERCVELYAESLSIRRAPFSSVLQVTVASAQARYARATGLVRTARALLSHITDMLLGVSARGTRLTQQQRAFLRLDAMHCAHNAHAAIQAVARGSGASMYLASNDLQRYQRDIDVLLGHLTLDQDWIEEMCGRLLLGVDSELDPARGLV